MAHIVKNVVTDGVYWIDIPAANLRVLCACPGDAVKHLTKRGFIGRLEEKGVTYETGPNAILLSDVAVQNGCFSNLAEFPVLQMLYRQGMIIPGHPGNIQVRPAVVFSEARQEACSGDGAGSAVADVGHIGKVAFQQFVVIAPQR